MLSEAGLLEALPKGRMGWSLHFFESVGSTNGEAAALARGGAPEGTLVVAEEQTHGRGRSGRTWHTPPGCALALSLVLRPPPERATGPGGVGLVGVMAVVEALARLDLEPRIKWPNDVLLEGRKTAGVLAEASWTADRLDFVVLGIGVNVRQGSIPLGAELEYPATWVEAASAGEVDRCALLSGIVEGVEHWYPRLGQADLLAAWEGRLAFRGEPVAIFEGGERLEGLLLGLTQDGWLRLATAEGEILELEPGDYRLRPAAPTIREKGAGSIGSRKH